MNTTLSHDLTEEEIDQLVKLRNELTLKIDSHFEKQKIAKINNNRKYIGKCYKAVSYTHLTILSSRMTRQCTNCLQAQGQMACSRLKAAVCAICF